MVQDPDKLCSYSTKQQARGPKRDFAVARAFRSHSRLESLWEVEIRDKWLGIIQCTMQTAMVTYIAALAARRGFRACKLPGAPRRRAATTSPARKTPPENPRVRLQTPEAWRLSPKP